MLALRRYSLGVSLGLLSLLACDRSQPVEPAVQAASTGAAGPTVKAPSNTNAVAVSESRIDVSWQDNSPNETGFEVHRSTTGPSGTFALLASTGAGVATYTNAGLSPLTPYCYRIRAFKRADGKTSYSGFSNTACATTPAPPAPTAPSGADAKPASSTTVDVRWIDNSTNEDGFRVQRSLDLGSTWTTVGTVGPNITSSVDGGRTSEQQVCYRIIAFNGAGDSPPSNTDCTTPPAAPTGLTATGVDGPAIDLAWTDNSASEDGYEVQRFTDGLGFSRLTDLPANSTSYRDAAVASNTTYWYRVRAKKDAGFSDLSNIASAGGSCVPTSPTEICDNMGLDDDCDGLRDGYDPDCPCEDCGDTCGQGYYCGAPGCCLPHCFSGGIEGDETDIDCGGPTCVARCAAGRACSFGSDCESGICVNNVCQ